MFTVIQTFTLLLPVGCDCGYVDSPTTACPSLSPERVQLHSCRKDLTGNAILAILSAIPMYFLWPLPLHSWIFLYPYTPLPVPVHIYTYNCTFLVYLHAPVPLYTIPVPVYLSSNAILEILSAVPMSFLWPVLLHTWIFLYLCLYHIPIPVPV